MVMVPKLTAELLLSAPRRSPGLPNAKGSLLLYSTSTHTFGEEGKTKKEYWIMSVENGQSRHLITDDKVHDALWIPGKDDQIIYLCDGEKGRTQLKAARTGDLPGQHSLLKEFDGPVSNLKVKLLSNRNIAFAVTGLIGDHGQLHNAKLAEKKKSTGRIFDTPNVRCWNILFRARTYGLWYGLMVPAPKQIDGGWIVSEHVYNLLQDTNLEPAGMYGLDDPLEHFDLCDQGIAFVARETNNRDPKARIDTMAFFSPVKSFVEPPSEKPRLVKMPDGIGPGVAGGMRISPEGSHIGFLHSDNDDTANQRLYLAFIEELAAFDVFKLITGEDDPDKYEPPEAFEFAGSSSEVIYTRNDYGKIALAHLKLEDGERPTTLTSEGSVSAYCPLREGDWSKLYAAKSSFIDSSLWQIINVEERRVEKTISSLTNNGSKYGLHSDMVISLWPEGADGRKFHTHVIMPSDIDKSKKYPWVVIPHGGPVSAWSDQWSTGWNQALWAEQGYIIFCPNISGSTGFGLEFARRVNDEWGGKPYLDLVNMISSVKKMDIPFIDWSKGILAGASYGGYMASWMLGHDVIKEFCCVILHDGIFHLPSFLLQTDYPADDAFFGGRPPWIWTNPIGLDKYNPARPELLRNWGRNAPPTLVIHSEKDYRIPITEGLAAFQTLQAQGVPSRFLTFQDESHVVSRPENSLMWHETVFDWMRRCVNGELKRGDTTW